jgi:hypothetical protein
MKQAVAVQAANAVQAAKKSKPKFSPRGLEETEDVAVRLKTRDGPAAPVTGSRRTSGSAAKLSRFEC